MQQTARCNYKCSVPQRQTTLRNAKPTAARAQQHWSQVSSSPKQRQHGTSLWHSLLEGPRSWADGSCQHKALPPSAICPDHTSSSHPSSTHFPTEMSFSRQLELQLSGFMPWSLGTRDGGHSRQNKGGGARQMTRQWLM